MLKRVIATSLILVAVLCALATSLHAAPKTGFTSFIVGNPADALPADSLVGAQDESEREIADTGRRGDGGQVVGHCHRHVDIGRELACAAVAARTRNAA